jgi:GT2 family glycosyltransferase
MKVSLVVVCHHSSRVLAQCVQSFRQEVAATGVDAEVVAIDHSEDPAEFSRVGAVGVDKLLERPNRGYAAGLNAGAKEATGDILLLANPDIVFFAGSLAALLDGIRQGFDVVGPQFVWDDGGQVLLPAAEDPSPRAELARALRRRSRWLWSATLAKTLDETLRLWTAQETLEIGALRGALLTVTREALTRFGAFDEGYFLYYEETEWLWRARRRGARLGLAADARVRHRWGHSTGRSEGAAEREESSRKRFVARNYSGLLRRIFRTSGGVGRSPLKLIRLKDVDTIPEVESELWLASPFPSLDPALGSIRSWAMPPAFLEFCRSWRWVVASAKREDGGWHIAGAWTWGS